MRPRAEVRFPHLGPLSHFSTFFRVGRVFLASVACAVALMGSPPGHDVRPTGGIPGTSTLKPQKETDP